MSCTYNRTWVEIEDMLERAERKQNMHFANMHKSGVNKHEVMAHMRNYKALEGVIKALKWTLGDKDIDHPLV